MYCPNLAEARAMKQHSSFCYNSQDSRKYHIFVCAQHKWRKLEWSKVPLSPRNLKNQIFLCGIYKWKDFFFRTWHSLRKCRYYPWVIKWNQPTSKFRLIWAFCDPGLLFLNFTTFIDWPYLRNYSTYIQEI